MRLCEHETEVPAHPASISTISTEMRRQRACNRPAFGWWEDGLLLCEEHLREFDDAAVELCTRVTDAPMTELERALDDALRVKP